MRLSDPRLADHLASAYVLGTLAPGARRRFEQVMRQRTDLQLSVSRWEATLGQLAQSVPPARPSPQVWRAISKRISRAMHADTAAPRASWWRPAGLGLAGLAAGAVVTIALLATMPSILFTPDQVAMRVGEKLPQSYVGLLTDASGEGKVLVSSLRHGRTMTVKVIGPIAPPAQGHLVLWAVPTDGPPFVLGEVPASGSVTSQLPDTSEKLLAKVRKLAVSVEAVPRPPKPGTVVLSGNCAKLW
jgi:anti-sigma-K factor RskA